MNVAAPNNRTREYKTSDKEPKAPRGTSSLAWTAHARLTTRLLKGWAEKQPSHRQAPPKSQVRHRGHAQRLHHQPALSE